jgi:hypothetical protein
MLVPHSSRVRLRPARRQAASIQWSGSRSQMAMPVLTEPPITSSRPSGRRAISVTSSSGMAMGSPSPPMATHEDIQMAVDSGSVALLTATIGL